MSDPSDGGDGVERQRVLDRVSRTASPRRGILKGAMSGVAALFGVTSMIELATSGSDEDVLARFDDPEVVADAFSVHEDMFRTVAEAGYVDAVEGLLEFDRSDRLEVPPNGETAFSASPRGRSVDSLEEGYLVTTAVVDGEATPQLFRFADVDGGLLVASVFPHLGERFAEVVTDEGLETFEWSEDVPTSATCDGPCFYCVYESCTGCTGCAVTT